MCWFLLDSHVWCIATREPPFDALTPICNVPDLQSSDEHLECLALPCCIHNGVHVQMGLLVVILILHLCFICTHVAGLKHIKKALVLHKVVSVDGMDADLVCLPSTQVSVLV